MVRWSDGRIVGLIPYLLSPAISVTDPDLPWLTGSAHLSFAPAVWPVKWGADAHDPVRSPR